MQITRNKLLAVVFILIASFCFSVVFANNDNNINGEKHRDTIRSVVQKISDIADNEETETGKEIKAVAKSQDEDKDNTSNAIDEIGRRSWLKTFFVGTDYKNIGQLRSSLVRTRNQINQLNRLLNKVTSTEDKADLQRQIQTLEQEQEKITNFIKTNESKFSLFGWVANWLNPPAPTIKIVTTGDKGKYLTDADGKSLYHFTNDTANKNNCTGACAINWPVFYVDSIVVGAPLRKADFGVITTDTGAKQITYKQQPLYYYINDTKAGDTLGDGVNNVWYLMRP